MPMAADIVPIVLRVPRREVAYVKFVFESYEGDWLGPDPDDDPP